MKTIKRILRITGGILLGIIALGFSTLSIGGFATMADKPGSIPAVLATVFCIVAATQFFQLAAYCLNSKYTKQLARRDLRQAT